MKILKHLLIAAAAPAAIGALAVPAIAQTAGMAVANP